MSSLIHSSLNSLSSQILIFLEEYKYPVLVTLSLPLIRLIYLDYRGWYNLGKGGLRHDPLGWMLQCILRMRCDRDVRSTQRYEEDINSSTLEAKSYLEDELPHRKGKPPVTSIWVAPHRQMEQEASSAAKKALNSVAPFLVSKNPTLLQILPSKLEGGSPSLHLTPHATTLFLRASNAQGSKRDRSKPPMSPNEIFHVHNTEGSSHVILSAKDASLVIERGWGERHALAGRALVPKTYLMVWAPRDEVEVEVLRMIVVAAARYAVGSTEEIKT
ncbi:MAG: hypothetical protein MMC33_003790 [Icmadophila ericetorum]|nr:hypothetical protein [Icmadophila ericetorum]